MLRCSHARQCRAQWQRCMRKQHGTRLACPTATSGLGWWCECCTCATTLCVTLVGFRRSDGAQGSRPSTDNVFNNHFFRLRHGCHAILRVGAGCVWRAGALTQSHTHTSVHTGTPQRTSTAQHSLQQRVIVASSAHLVAHGLLRHAHAQHLVERCQLWVVGTRHHLLSLLLLLTRRPPAGATCV